MFNFRNFDKIFNEMFSEGTGFNLGDKKWTKETYKSPDGSFTYTYMTRGKSNELHNLKEKLNLAIEDQNFEEAVELRDKIKKLEENKEKISELQSKLDESIKNQDFEKCIQYRDEIKKLK
jgi:excinuclease UvrABC helicase subunit UvrB